jgi:hypothetical protein
MLFYQYFMLIFSFKKTLTQIQKKNKEEEKKLTTIVWIKKTKKKRI